MAHPIRRPAAATDRVLALSDGVIAIVITPLVLDLTVPPAPGDQQLALLPAAIVEQWPEFPGFVLRFFVVGFYRVPHRRTWVYIERHDRGVVSLNRVFGCWSRSSPTRGVCSRPIPAASVRRFSRASWP